MENVHLKTIEELNECFLTGNRGEAQEKIPVTYDGEALVTYLQEAEASPAENADFDYRDIFYELPSYRGGFASLTEKLSRKLRSVKKFFK